MSGHRYAGPRSVVRVLWFTGGAVALLAALALLAGVEFRSWRLAPRSVVVSLFRWHDGLIALQSARWWGGARALTHSTPNTRRWYDFNTMPVLTFKVTDPEARIIRSRARADRTSLSAYLRRAALGRETPAKPTRIVHRRHPESGLTYNAALGRVVTDDEIRAALADFP